MFRDEFGANISRERVATAAKGSAMVSGISQRKALNDTALGTANWLVSWGKRLKEEMRKQNIDRHAKRTPIPGATRLQKLAGTDHTTDDEETIVFQRKLVRELLDDMSERVERLRRFEKPPGKHHTADD